MLNVVLAGCLSVAADAPKCPWASKSDPIELSGTVQDGAGKYNFRHISDVEKGSGKLSYVRQLVNLHKTNVLPAEWKGASIEFDQIAPGKCAHNSFDSTNGYSEVGSEVKYGPTKQLSKNAKLYDTNPKQPMKMSGLPLESKIAAEIQLSQGVNIRVDVVFKTKVEKLTDFTYEVKNSGDREIVFQSSKLDTLLGESKKKFSLLAKEEWKSKDGSIPLQVSEEQRLVYKAGEAVARIEEKQVPVELFYQGKKVASGVVTVYVPAQ